MLLEHFEVYPYHQARPAKINFLSCEVSAGFPSPAEDYIQNRLDLEELLIQSPSSTYFMRVKGNSMKDVGILSEDILVVDRAKIPKNKDIVVASLDGEMVVKRFETFNDETFLVSENREYPPIRILPDQEFAIWGVVLHAIHSFKQ